MRTLVISMFFALASLLLILAIKTGIGRRAALTLCLLGSTLALGCSSANGNAKPAEVVKSDPLKLGKVWSDYSNLATRVEKVTAGPFDDATYQQLSKDLNRVSADLNQLVSSRGKSEQNAVKLLASMYSSLLFDWFAMNSMITCYSPQMAPTDPVDIAQGRLNGRLIEITNQFSKKQISASAYKTALGGIAEEQSQYLDNETRQLLARMLDDCSTIGD